MGMKVLYLEDRGLSIENILSGNKNRFEFKFVNTVTGIHELLIIKEGYRTYGAVVIDLSIEMPNLTKSKIIKRIPEFNIEGIPTVCAGNIPLYGYDYYRLVLIKHEEIKNSFINKGRIIIFSGHAAKARTEGLYNETMEIFINTPLIDRAALNATNELFSKLAVIEKNLQPTGGS